LEFEKIIELYPNNRYADDAHFWIGYCLEKIPERQIEAFMRFEKVVNKFPQSSWVDDAQVHQITLAEQFILVGKNQYNSFLLENLKSDLPDIRNRAALALGRLGNISALPILKNLQNDNDLGSIASELTTLLEKNELPDYENTKDDSSRKTLNIIVTSEGEKKDNEEEDTSLFSLFSTQRYEQYKSMLRKDNEWSKSELNNFALWHIIDTDDFQEYFTLSNEYDKKEWIRKYWKKQDPTPTTETNEMKEEFDRRIIYVRSHFSSFWNYKHFKYLPDQHLKYGWDHAPWDARGELYIKYGEPDIRSNEGWHTEEWIYYRYSVDFIVKQYMTNIYGNAITGGALSQRSFGGGDRDWYIWEPYLQANFIYYNEMKYDYNYDAEPIDDLEMDINSNESGVIINYLVPADEFTENNDVSYVENIVVFNNDYREVTRKSFERKISDLNNDIAQKIEIELPAGEYHLVIKINDLNSKKLGIYKSEIRVEK